MPTVTVSLWQGAVDGILKFVDEVGQSALIQTVDTRSPKAGSTKARRVFSTFAEVTKMAFDTSSGRTTFDGVGVERVFEVTGYMSYIEGVNSEQVVVFDGKIYKILNVEDIGLIHGVLVLELSLLGDCEKSASES